MGDDAGESIRRLLASYCHHIDDRALSQWLELFQPDGALIVNGEVHRGHDAMRRWVDSLGAPEQRGRHLCTNAVIDVQGDSAGCLSDWIYVDFSFAVMAMGRYRDSLVNNPNRGCRFESRSVELNPGTGPAT